MDRYNYDTIVIGSGFGGAIMACRLAQKGDRVLVLERGRRWQTRDFPRQPDDPWIFNPDSPHKHNGWFDFRFFSKVMVAQGAGVGGGSLVYSNVSIEASPKVFERGWPPQLTYESLKPYYRKTGSMLKTHEIPTKQQLPRYEILKEGASRLGYKDRVSLLPLALRFDPDYDPSSLDDPYDLKHSKSLVNEHGVEQGTCVHLGNCVIGCEARAKNSLDMNYIPMAERHGAEIRPLHMVDCITKEENGYIVHFNRIEDGKLFPGSEFTKRVVVAAGSLGSTELLLRCRDIYKTLPNLSSMLGRNWSTNGDFLTPAFYTKRGVFPVRGPNITAGISFMDRQEYPGRFHIEDGGFPGLLETYRTNKVEDRTNSLMAKSIIKGLRILVRNWDISESVMPWFAQGVDSGKGRLYLGRSKLKPWKRKMKLEWRPRESADVINSIIDVHKRLTKATGGKAWEPLTWKWLKYLVTPHPLGGCAMGGSVRSGVVDHRCEVFGYPNLYVVDGSVFPSPLGRNPSRTIAALAERAADLINE